MRLWGCRAARTRSAGRRCSRPRAFLIQGDNTSGGTCQMIEQAAKAARFRALHDRPEPLLLPNPWDAGTARLLAGLGFEALATTSLGVANMFGHVRASRQEILDNCRALNE